MTTHTMTSHTLMLNPTRIALAAVLVAMLVAAAGAADTPPANEPAAAAKDAGDIARKAEIMNSQRWRRAIFELGEWLSSQQIYSPQEVNRIKADFNRKVAGMTSYELEYLLEDLDAKFKIMETSEAKDARAWVGQYLAAMSYSKRAEVLKDVPDVTRMSAGDLADEIKKIEAKKQQLVNQQAAFNQSRRDIVSSQQQSIAATQRAVASANRS